MWSPSRIHFWRIFLHWQSCVMQTPMQVFHRLGFPSPHPRPMPWTPLYLSLPWLHPCSVFLSYSYQHISFLFIFWYEEWSQVREALWQRNHEMKELRELPVISQEHVGRKHRNHLITKHCVIGQHHPFIAFFSFPILHGAGEFITFTF